MWCSRRRNRNSAKAVFSGFVPARDAPVRGGVPESWRGATSFEDVGACGGFVPARDAPVRGGVPEAGVARPASSVGACGGFVPARDAPVRRGVPETWRGATSFEEAGAPGRIRTCDLRLRRPTLYPAELRARVGKHRVTDTPGPQTRNDQCSRTSAGRQTRRVRRGAGCSRVVDEGVGRAVVCVRVGRPRRAPAGCGWPAPCRVRRPTGRTN